MLRSALKGNNFNFENLRAWDLYETKVGWQTAARKLSNQAKKIHDTIINDSDLVELLELKEELE